jgi:hypothetical protein
MDNKTRVLLLAAAAATVVVFVVDDFDRNATVNRNAITRPEICTKYNSRIDNHGQSTNTVIR